MVKGFSTPRQWLRDELASSRSVAEELFKQERRDEGPRAFAAVYHEIEPAVRDALEATDYLRSLVGDVFVYNPGLIDVLRYVCGPPISEEDLWTLVGGPKFRRVPPALASETAEVLSMVIDPVRFPWVDANRKPTRSEAESAIMATTALMAVRQVATARRGSSSKRQESAVTAALADAGYRLDGDRQQIWVLDSMDRGSYSQERRVAGAKCDVPVRLHDGRLLAVECKVSNGPKNGWKRVNREVGGKAETWRSHFGTQVITSVVLAGVFDLSCLLTAQEQHVSIFWEHDLSALTEFVSAG